MRIQREERQGEAKGRFLFHGDGGFVHSVMGVTEAQSFGDPSFLEPTMVHRYYMINMDMPFHRIYNYISHIYIYTYKYLIILYYIIFYYIIL